MAPADRRRTDGAERDVPRQLVERLERLLTERFELLEKLGRSLGGGAKSDCQNLHERLARLVQEEKRLLDELTSILPPDEPPSGDARRVGSLQAPCT